MKRLFYCLCPLFFLVISTRCRAQKIDSIYVHLYTDSLKKGTYNYINIDGLLSSGHYIPLDSSQLIFKSSSGKFFGNSLYIERDFPTPKVEISVYLKSNPSLRKDFTMFVKKKEDNERLPTTEDVLRGKKRN